MQDVARKQTDRAEKPQGSKYEISSTKIGMLSEHRKHF